MDPIAEEDEKDVPLSWWSTDKRTTQSEVVIPLGRERRHSLNLPRSPYAADTPSAPFSPKRSLASPPASPSPGSPKARGLTVSSPSYAARPSFVPSPLTPTTSDNVQFQNEPFADSNLTKNTTPNTPKTPTNIPTNALSNSSNNVSHTSHTTPHNTVDIPNNNVNSNSAKKSPTRASSMQRVGSRRNSDGDKVNPLPKLAFLREMAEREIVETETAYVKDLAICIEEFYMPMKAKEIISKQELEDIFINIEAIASLHIELEKDLRAHANIPRTFQKMTPFLRMYSSYCGNGTKALETLIKCKKNPTVDKFLYQCLTKESVKGQPLESYLIKPTQRLCKYPLLLQSLLSNTIPGTTEHKELEQVLDQIKAAVLGVNEKKRQVETLQVLEQLKSQIVGGVEALFAKTAVFHKEGQLTVLGDPQETLSFYLFDDILLATKPKGKKHKKQLVYTFGLDRMLVKDIIKLDESVPKTSFNLWTYQNDKKINLRLVAPLEREKRIWISVLEKAISTKAAHLHEVFCKLSVETIKTDGAKPLIFKSPSASFDTWFLQRKVRLFGEDIVLKYDQQIEQLMKIRETMTAAAEKERQRWEQEEAETDPTKQKTIVQAYKNAQMQKMEYINQLLSKLASLESKKGQITTPTKNTISV